MDCGIPFCHDGCPLGNRIPDWNDLVRTGDWEFAVESLHATNNFPEFTGRLCPAPCEARACSASATATRSTIKLVEVEIINRAFDGGHGGAAPGARARPAAAVGRGRLRPGRAGRRPAARPGRPRRHRVRARRRGRRAAALRHPGLQAGEARTSTARLAQLRGRGRARS